MPGGNLRKKTCDTDRDKSRDMVQSESSIETKSSNLQTSDTNKNITDLRSANKDAVTVDLTKNDEGPLALPLSSQKGKTTNAKLKVVVPNTGADGDMQALHHTTDSQTEANVPGNMPAHRIFYAMQPMRCYPPRFLRRKPINKCPSQNLPITLNIGGQIRHFPATTAASNSRSSSQQQQYQAIPLVTQAARVYMSQNSGLSDYQSNALTSFHQHFLENPSEKGVLGSIFVNHLLQQSIVDYQKMRSAAYPYMLQHAIKPPDQNVLTTHPEPLLTSHNPSNCHNYACRNLRKSQTKATELDANASREAITKSVTSTFTSPSPSSAITMAQLSDGFR